MQLCIYHSLFGIFIYFIHFRFELIRNNEFLSLSIIGINEMIGESGLINTQRHTTETRSNGKVYLYRILINEFIHRLSPDQLLNCINLAKARKKQRDELIHSAITQRQVQFDFLLFLQSERKNGCVVSLRVSINQLVC